MMYKPDDGVGNSGGSLGGVIVVVLGEMLVVWLVTSRSSIDQELPTFSRLRLLEAKLRLWRLPNPPPPPPEDASDDEAGVTGDSRCLMWSILQGASHFENRRSIRKLKVVRFDLNYLKVDQLHTRKTEGPSMYSRYIGSSAWAEWLTFLPS
jgi:hypothetical protein